MSAKINSGTSGKQAVANCQDGTNKTWNAVNDPNEQKKCKDAVNQTATGVKTFVHDEKNKKQVNDAANQTVNAFKKGFSSFKKKK